MFAIEFQLKLSSMYSIRVPYSYQCARTYPLPAPSTMKGLCANALWEKEGGNPEKKLKEIHDASIGATSRAEKSIIVSTCTINNLILDTMQKKFKTNALLRQFAFTPYVDCLIVLKEGRESLRDRIVEALKVSPVYLGDSESLVSVMPETVQSVPNIEEFNEGTEITINSLVKFDFIKDRKVTSKGVVLYMQDDPCADDAILERYIAPLMQEGDIYKPLESFSFISAKKGIVVKGNRVQGIFSEDKQTESTAQKPKRERKKKAS